MRAALRPRYSLEEYLEIEETSGDVKHEYVSGEIYAMAGGSPEHAAVTNALALLIGSHLRGGPCRTYSSDLRISIAALDVFTYADLTVVCDPVERDPSSVTHVTNPRIVVEVLSPGTERYDREQKRLYYQQLASLSEYVLVAQDRRQVEVWQRDGEGWTHRVHRGGELAPLPSIRFALDVDELYVTAGL
jgi:Uma2 family endonuclease